MKRLLFCSVFLLLINAVALAQEFEIKKYDLKVDVLPAEQRFDVQAKLTLVRNDGPDTTVTVTTYGVNYPASYDFFTSADGAVRTPDAGVEQPQVVVDLGDRADGRARAAAVDHAALAQHADLRVEVVGHRRRRIAQALEHGGEQRELDAAGARQLATMLASIAGGDQDGGGLPQTRRAGGRGRPGRQRATRRRG